MATMTDADVAYVRANYVTLGELCAGRAETPVDVTALIDQGLLPRPSYVLPDGTAMFPRDYLDLLDDAGAPERLRAEFERRYSGADIEEDWAGYLSGLFGVCLREVTPETIARKGELVERLEELLAEPRRDDAAWCGELRAKVDELDELERPFSPHHDRIQFGRPPTRDTLIAAPRERYRELLTQEA